MVHMPVKVGTNLLDVNNVAAATLQHASSSSAAAAVLPVQQCVAPTEALCMKMQLYCACLSANMHNNPSYSSMALHNVWMHTILSTCCTGLLSLRCADASQKAGTGGACTCPI